MTQLFEVTLTHKLVQTQHAVVQVEAVSEDDAREKAQQLNPETLAWADPIKELPRREFGIEKVEILADLEAEGETPSP